MADPLNPLVAKVRAAYPGVYDDMDDAKLTKMVLAKHPGYEDLAAPSAASSAARPNIPELSGPGGPPPPAPPDMTQSAGSRFWGGAKAALGGENISNTGVDPDHPWATNPMLPGAGVYRDFKSGNTAGALGRIAGPVASLLPAAMIRGVEEPPLGSIENPGVFSKIPLRTKPSVLAEEEAAIRPVPKVPAPKTAEEYMNHPWSGERTGLPYKPNPGRPGIEYTPRPAPIPARQGLMLPEGNPAAAPEGEVLPPERSLSQLGPKRGRFGPPLRPNVFASPEEAQIYDSQIARLGAEAKDTGLYSAARGKVGRTPDYQERAGRALRDYGPPEDADAIARRKASSE